PQVRRVRATRSINVCLPSRLVMLRVRWVRRSTVTPTEVSSVQHTSRRGRPQTGQPGPSDSVSCSIVPRMGSSSVWILGGYQSDFSRNLSREGLDFANLTTEVVDSTLAAASVDADAIEVVHVANAFGELFARQAHLGATPAPVHEGPWRIP